MDGWMPVTDGGARVLVARDEAGFSGTAGFLGIWAGRHQGMVGTLPGDQVYFEITELFGELGAKGGCECLFS